VDVQPGEADVLELLGRLEDPLRPDQVDAELRLLLARADVGVGLGIHVRVHPQRDRRLAADLAGDPVDVRELLLALDVEEQDALLERVGDLFVVLADAREDDLLRVGADLQRAV
jgi:hypothetical protein